eukprot:GHVU01109907.1.p1 GENE.GHVU01109907.1~~GHVU01109907.1.p1  ORF type:complete len:133 (+),score=18.19 GHVU01109907.1:10-408(+)
MTPTIVVDDNNNCDGGRLTERASERAQEGRQASRAERESAMPRLAGWLARSKDELVRPIHPIYNLRDVNGVDGHNGRQLRKTRSSLRRARQTNNCLFVYLFISFFHPFQLRWSAKKNQVKKNVMQQRMELIH